MKRKQKQTKYDVISISHFFYPRIGGLENMAYQTLSYLTDQGLKCLAIFGNSKDTTYTLRGITCKSFNCLKLFNGTYPVLGLRYFWFIVNSIRKNPQAKILIYDRHLTSSVVGWLACVVTNHPYVLVSQTTDSSFFRSKIADVIATILENTIFKMIVRNANEIVAVSEANKTYLIEHFGAQPEVFTVIYNGFNEEAIENFTHAKRREKTVVFAVKVLIPVKDPDTTAKAYLRIAENHPDWKFMLIGEGNTILDEIENLPANIEYTQKAMPQYELFELIGRSSIYINSSLQEGLSLGITEAAALGALPIVSDAPSNLEVANQLGTDEYTFTRQNSAELAAKIELAIENYKKHGYLRSKLKKSAHTHFALSQNLGKYYQLLVK